MPNKCSAPGCKQNYSSTDYATVFKLPKTPELRHQWIQALHLVDIPANTFVCENHFRVEDISRTHFVPSGPNGILQEVPSNDDSVHFLFPQLENSTITIQATLTINSQLSTKASLQNEPTSLSLEFVSDIRQIETLLDEILNNPLLNNTNTPTDSTQYHIQSAKTHIIKAIDTIDNSCNGDSGLLNEDNISISAYLPRLHFILCQLENIMVPKNRRRYNVITQVLSLKAHIYSHSCYTYNHSTVYPYHTSTHLKDFITSVKLAAKVATNYEHKLTITTSATNRPISSKFVV